MDANGRESLDITIDGKVWHLRLDTWQMIRLEEMLNAEHFENGRPGDPPDPLSLVFGVCKIVPPSEDEVSEHAIKATAYRELHSEATPDEVEKAVPSPLFRYRIGSWGAIGKLLWAAGLNEDPTWTFKDACALIDTYRTQGGNLADLGWTLRQSWFIGTIKPPDNGITVPNAEAEATALH